MARRVQEGDHLARIEAYLEGADVLRDAAELALHDARVPKVVEQRRFACVQRNSLFSFFSLTKKLAEVHPVPLAKHF